MISNDQSTDTIGISFSRQEVNQHHEELLELYLESTKVIAFHEILIDFLRSYISYPINELEKEINKCFFHFADFMLASKAALVYYDSEEDKFLDIINYNDFLIGKEEFGEFFSEILEEIKKNKVLIFKNLNESNKNLFNKFLSKNNIKSFISISMTSDDIFLGFIIFGFNFVIDDKSNSKKLLLLETFSRINADIILRKKLKDELEEIEKKFTLLVNNSSDGILITDKDKKIIFWNKHAEEIFGYKSSQILNKNIKELFTSKNISINYESPFEKFYEHSDGDTEKISTMEVPAFREDGSKIYIEVSLFQFTHGKNKYYSGIFRDITKRKREEVKSKYRNLILDSLNRSTDLELALQICVDYMDEFLLKEYGSFSLFFFYDDSYNKLKLLDYCIEKNKKLEKVYDLLLGEEGLYIPSLLLKSRMHNVLELGALSRNTIQKYVEELDLKVFKNKNIFSIDDYFLSPITFGTGRLHGIIYAFVRGASSLELFPEGDISYREEIAEELNWMSKTLGISLEKERCILELNRSLTYRSALMEAIPDILLILDYDGMILDYHVPKNLLGKKIGIYISKFRNILEFDDKSFSEKLLEMLQSIRNKRRAVSFDSSARFLDCNKYFDIKMIPFTEDRVLVAIRDITDRKILEQNLRKQIRNVEELNKTKSRFLGSMSHELRTPLTGVLGVLEILSMYDLSTVHPELNKYVLVAKNSGGLLNDLLSDILMLTKMEFGKVNLKNEPFDIRESIRKVIEIFLTTTKKKISFSFNVDENVPKILIGDSVRIKQILVNLIGNSVKFTLSGKIEVNVSKLPYRKNKDKSMFLFSVSDEGCGIPPDKQNAIFKSFVQVESGFAAENELGAGLGLSIVKHIVWLMNGTISVDSDIGEGTTIYFTLELGEEG